VEPDSDPAPPNSRRRIARLAGAILLGLAAFLVFLFTACGVVVGFGVLFTGHGNDLGVALLGLGCALVGGGVLFALNRLSRRF